jgi:hypothetical protein
MSLGALGQAKREKPSKGQPTVVPASEIHGLIEELSKRGHFSPTGLAYFNGKLYAGTNLGIVELVEGVPTRLFKFQASDAVVSGPWLDSADHLLWAVDEHTGRLLCFDGNTWSQVPVPTPKKGEFTRGDVLAGWHPIGNDHGFWLQGAGTVWRWNQSSRRWLQITTVPSQGQGKVSKIVGVLPIGETPLLIVRHEPLPFHPRSYGFVSDEIVLPPDPSSDALPYTGKAWLADTWAITEGAGYICTKDRMLIEIRMDRVAAMDAPGPCDTVATDDKLDLLVSVRDKGVYQYAEGIWTLLADAAYAGDGKHQWTYLAGYRGQLGLALDAMPSLDARRSNGSDVQFTQDAETGLWVLTQGHFRLTNF